MHDAGLRASLGDFHTCLRRWAFTHVPRRVNTESLHVHVHKACPTPMMVYIESLTGPGQRYTHWGRIHSAIYLEYTMTLMKMTMFGNNNYFSPYVSGTLKLTKLGLSLTPFGNEAYFVWERRQNLTRHCFIWS